MDLRRSVPPFALLGLLLVVAPASPIHAGQADPAGGEAWTPPDIETAQQIECPNRGRLVGYRPRQKKNAPPLDPNAHYGPIQQMCMARLPGGRRVPHGPLLGWYPNGVLMLRDDYEWGVLRGGVAWDFNGNRVLAYYTDDEGERVPWKDDTTGLDAPVLVPGADATPVEVDLGDPVEVDLGDPEAPAPAPTVTVTFAPANLKESDAAFLREGLPFVEDQLRWAASRPHLGFVGESFAFRLEVATLMGGEWPFAIGLIDEEYRPADDVRRVLNVWGIPVFGSARATHVAMVLAAYVVRMRERALVEEHHVGSHMVDPIVYVVLQRPDTGEALTAVLAIQRRDAPPVIVPPLQVKSAKGPVTEVWSRTGYESYPGTLGAYPLDPPAWSDGTPTPAAALYAFLDWPPPRATPARPPDDPGSAAPATEP